MTAAPLTTLAAGPAVVALGGGHGLAASLSALRRVTSRLTAVVTVADDGGSSGRLRAELGALPPGDLRMAVAALAGSDPGGARWAAVLQHRFGGRGELAQHAVGNLLLTGLAEVTGNPVASLELLVRLVNGTGRVLPLSAQPMDLVAAVAGLDRADPEAVRPVRGQVAIATTPGKVRSIRTVPERPVACAEALQAVQEAEWIILGPGSWFTSVLPHLIVPDFAAALRASTARRVLVLNLAPQLGETEDFQPSTYLEVLREHAPGLGVDVVLADESVDTGDTALLAAAGELGARVVRAGVAAADGTPRHDVEALAVAFRSIFTGTPNETPTVRTAQGEHAWR
ncbi:MAG: uridine diphosphate-N-acetylglucosamine-binding protein YvcK [Actinomycetota bacterium]|nr:uridine diphosphate-N-acetylglucosamine-binding protein YvcK [Actinomycetota bacterium]